MKLLTLINAVLAQSEAAVEAVLDLTNRANDTTNLEKASCAGKIILDVLSSAKVGAPAYTISGLEVSYDGTNYVLAQGTLGIDPCTTPGQFHVQITFPLIGVRKLRLVMAGSAPDGSNYVTLTAQLRMAAYAQ